MWDCLRNLKTYELELEEGRSARERRSILRHLHSRRGVLDVRATPGEPPRLVIIYDAYLVGPLRLIDFLRLRGIVARPAATQTDAARRESGRVKAA